MRSRMICGLALMCVAQTSTADVFEAHLSQDAAQFSYIRDSGLLGSGDADLGFGLFFNDDSDIMLSLGLSVSGVPAGDQGFSFGVGGRVYLGFVDDPSDDFQAVALGAEVRYTIPGNTPLHLAASGYFAPGVTTFGDADNFHDIWARFEVQVTPGAAAFVGYRHVEAELDRDSSYRLDDNVHLGVRFNF